MATEEKSEDKKIEDHIQWIKMTDKEFGEAFNMTAKNRKIAGAGLREEEPKKDILKRKKKKPFDILAGTPLARPAAESPRGGIPILLRRPGYEAPKAFKEGKEKAKSKRKKKSAPSQPVNRPKRPASDARNTETEDAGKQLIEGILSDTSWKTIKGRTTKELTAQQEGIERLENYRRKLASAGDSKGYLEGTPGVFQDARPWMAASDMFFDTDLLKKFEKHLPAKALTERQKIERDMKIEAELQGLRGDLTKAKTNLVKENITSADRQLALTLKDSIARMQEGGKNIRHMSAQEIKKYLGELGASTKVKVQGMKNAGKGKGRKTPKAFQYKAAGYALRLQQSNKLINDLLNTKKKVDFFTSAKAAAQRKTALISGKWQSDELRQMRQAELNFMNAFLRPESGAVISPSEFATAEKEYFPRWGDDAKTLAQKKENRDAKVLTAIVEGGPAWDEILAQKDAPPKRYKNIGKQMRFEVWWRYKQAKKARGK